MEADVGNREPSTTSRPARHADLSAAVLESLPDAVIACDADGVIVMSNRAARESLSAPEEAVAAEDWTGAWVTRDRAGIELTKEEQPLARALRGQEVRDVEVRVSRDGETQILSVAGGPLRGSDGETAGAMVFIQDVTRRVAADDHLRLHGEIAARIPAGVGLIRAADGEILHANGAWHRMLGYANGELPGRHLSAVTAPGAEAPVARAQAVTHALEQRGMWDGEIRNVRKDGTRFWCAATISTFEHPEQGPTWILAQTDISKEKAAEEALRLAEERFRKVFEEAPVGIALTGNDLRVTDTNEVLSEITGYSREDLVGKTLADITHRDDIGLDAALMAKVFNGEIPRYQSDRRFVTKQGDVIPVALNATCVRDAADRPRHCIVIVEPSTASPRA